MCENQQKTRIKRATGQGWQTSRSSVQNLHIIGIVGNNNSRKCWHISLFHFSRFIMCFSTTCHFSCIIVILGIIKIVNVIISNNTITIIIVHFSSFIIHHSSFVIHHSSCNFKFKFILHACGQPVLGARTWKELVKISYKVLVVLHWVRPEEKIAKSSVKCVHNSMLDARVCQSSVCRCLVYD